MKKIVMALMLLAFNSYAMEIAYTTHCNVVPYNDDEPCSVTANLYAQRGENGEQIVKFADVHYNCHNQSNQWRIKLQRANPFSFVFGEADPHSVRFEVYFDDIGGMSTLSNVEADEISLQCDME